MISPKKIKLLTASVIILIIHAVVVRFVIGQIIFVPRLASKDAHEVVSAYFEARKWGYSRLAKRALARELLTEMDAPNYFSPAVDDVLFAGELVISKPFKISLYSKYDHEIQFAVTYRSRWNSITCGLPGNRHWFVYAGSDTGKPWKILSQGTGP